MRFLILKWFGSLCLKLIYKTCKIEIRGQNNFDNIYNKGKPIMLCVWHGRMIFPIFYLLKKHLSPWAIASSHQDGAMIASILKKWNIKII